MKYTNKSWSHPVGMTEDYRNKHDLIFSKVDCISVLIEVCIAVDCGNNKLAVDMVEKAVKILVYQEKFNELEHLQNMVFANKSLIVDTKNNIRLVDIFISAFEEKRKYDLAQTDSTT